MPADGTPATASALASERLADVLSALTDESRGAWLAILRKYGGALPRDVRFNRDAIRWGKPWQATEAGGMREARVYQRSWLTIPDARHPDGAVTHAHLVTPAEALELLATRGVWPWEVGADDAPRWWCDGCEGTGMETGGTSGHQCRVCADRYPEARWSQRMFGTLPCPPDLPALVAAASMGDALREAVGTGRDLARDAFARVALRVAPREAIDADAPRMIGTTGVRLLGVSRGAVTLGIVAIGAP